MSESLFNQLAPLCFFQNDTPTQLLSCEFCQVLKNIIFTEQPRVAASECIEQICNIKNPGFN